MLRTFVSIIIYRDDPSTDRIPRTLNSWVDANSHRLPPIIICLLPSVSSRKGKKGAAWGKEGQEFSRSQGGLGSGKICDGCETDILDLVLIYH